MKTKILIDNSPTYDLKNIFLTKEAINLFWTTQVNYNLLIDSDVYDLIFEGEEYVDIDNLTFCNKNNYKKSFYFDIIMNLEQRNLLIKKNKDFELIYMNNVEELAYYFDKEIEKLNLIPKKIILLEKRIFKDSDFDILQQLKFVGILLT